MPQVTISSVPSVEVDDDEITRWITRQLNETRNYFVETMGRQGTGGMRKRRGVTYYYSSPGAYPVRQSGRLASSVAFEMTGKTSGRIFVQNSQEGGGLNYAGYLTTGTSRMAARKMLADALSDVLSRQPEPPKPIKVIVR